MKIAVTGADYVGLLVVTLLVQNNIATLVDVVPKKTEKTIKVIIY